MQGYGCRFKTKCNWLEFCWTLIPGLILCVLGYFSWENLYSMELTEKADYHLKVIGHQWYWEYEYFVPRRFMGAYTYVNEVGLGAPFKSRSSSIGDVGHVLKRLGGLKLDGAQWEGESDKSG